MMSFRMFLETNQLTIIKNKLSGFTKRVRYEADRVTDSFWEKFDYLLFYFTNLLYYLEGNPDGDSSYSWKDDFLESLEVFRNEKTAKSREIRFQNEFLAFIDNEFLPYLLSIAPKVEQPDWIDDSPENYYAR